MLPLSEVLEEHGLTQQEYNQMCLIIQRPNMPVDRLVGVLKSSSGTFHKIARNLVDLGLAGTHTKSGGTVYHPTEKARSTRRDIINMQKQDRDPDSLPDAPDVPELTDEQGVRLGNLVEIGNIIEQAQQMCRLNHEWIRILALLRGVGEPMTPCEIQAYLDPPSGAIDVLELKLAKKANTQKKEADEYRWIEAVEGEGGVAAYQITKAGADAIDLVMEDLQDRLAGDD